MKKHAIRTGNIQDATALAELGRKTFVEAFGEVNAPEDMSIYLRDNYTVEKVSGELQDNKSIFFLAEDDTRLLGFAKVNLESTQDLPEGKSFEIERLYVLKEKIGSGIGKALMLHCLDFAKQQGCNSVWLGVWEHNKPAIDFYHRFGFEKFGQHVFMLGNDPQTDFLFKKKLA